MLNLPLTIPMSKSLCESSRPLRHYRIWCAPLSNISNCFFQHNKPFQHHKISREYPERQFWKKCANKWLSSILNPLTLGGREYNPPQLGVQGVLNAPLPVMKEFSLSLCVNQAYLYDIWVEDYFLLFLQAHLHMVFLHSSL